MTSTSLAAALMLMSAVMVQCYADEPIWLTDMDDAAVVYKNVPGIDINAATRRLLLEHMPGYQDSVSIVNNERAFQILKSNTLACTGNKVRNAERETFAYFTALPQLIFPGLRLYMLQATAKQAGLSQNQPQEATQSLAALSAILPQARIGIVGGRNYGEPLQQLFAQLARRNRIYTRTASDMTAAALLDMLVNGRIELIVEYPNVVQHYTEALHHAVPLASVNITEATEYSGGYIMCSKTEQGQKLAQLYNDAIRQASQDKRYLQAHLRWFDSSSHAKITALYNQVYHTNF
ncbi:transporter substrate-binding domain-containing protein [Rheinheimera muenzenbergensis]|uniref:Transporter substrate-binding domain-containing protein n=1 Tax=Rheinheimera muenzenbergensis TaxID=1193628 RepID=A0ABU8C786_9GAMM